MYWSTIFPMSDAPELLLIILPTIPSVLADIKSDAPESSVLLTPVPTCEFASVVPESSLSEYVMVLATPAKANRAWLWLAVTAMATVADSVTASDIFSIPGIAGALLEISLTEIAAVSVLLSEIEVSETSSTANGNKSNTVGLVELKVPVK